MPPDILQLLFSGVTVGATYALAALGFTLIYNASNVINFAQGEFIMLGGMLAVFFVGIDLPLPLVLVLSILIPAVVGVAVAELAIAPARGADTVSLIIITIGVALILRGFMQIWRGKATAILAPFSGDVPILIGGAALLPQSLWVLGTSAVIVIALALFFSRSLLGKAILATSIDPLAAQLVGINTRFVVLVSFALSAAIGAIGGIVVSPITMTSYDVGIMLGLKGFVAVIVGGLGSAPGAVVGGLMVGIVEQLAAGSPYISSAYKDAVPFLLIFVILFFRPRGLFGAKVSERV
ncbi:MAG: branched-chain amino acid ABC transporter permease [Alphaproteobacteria bacterium]|nr:branched-chain amino acid ABC transporter permease [Alphaproteobacteria bacterium]